MLRTILIIMIVLTLMTIARQSPQIGFVVIFIIMICSLIATNQTFKKNENQQNY